MHSLKLLAFSILGCLISCVARGSVPRQCVEDDAHIAEALGELGITAKSYVEEHGDLPGPWSEGIYQIISNASLAGAVGGNISPGFDGEYIELACSDLNLNMHTVYSVSIKTLETEKRDIKVLSRSR